MPDQHNNNNNTYRVTKKMVSRPPPTSIIDKEPIIIGKSFQQRNIYLYEYFVDKPKFNVFVHGAEHGIEWGSGDSVVMLMEDIEANPEFYDDVNIVALPYWNVDGIVNNTYDNAQGYQIGYSCLNLVCPEWRALWEYLINHQYYPDFVINNHNLDHSNRGAGMYFYDHDPRLALKENLVIALDTSSLHRHKMTWNQWTDMVKHVSDNGGGLVYDKFWRMKDDFRKDYLVGYDVGYSMSWFAQRFDSLTTLIEGVAPENYPNENDPDWANCKRAQFLANKYMIDYVRTKCPQLVESKCVPPYTGERVPIYESQPYYELFPERVNVVVDSTNANFSLWSISTKWRYTQTDEVKHFTTIPLAYAVHNTNEDDLNYWLKYFAFLWTQGQSGDSYDVEQFHCTAAGAWDDQDGSITNQWTQLGIDGYNVSSTRTNFSNYTIYPTNQFGSDALTNILEPMALGNISRHQTLFPTLNLRANDDFPILRLIRKR